MKLSIIIPVYNNEPTIKRCLDSILKQKTDLNYEVLVVNDGSNDNSLAILEQYSKKNNKITLLRQQNSGVSSARNLGLRHAQGEYIMFVDGDDFLSNDWADTIQNAMENKEADYIIFSNYLPANSVQKLTAEQICGFSNEKTNASAIGSKLYRHQIIKEHNLKFNENIVNGEDLLFNLEFNLYCNNTLRWRTGFYNYNVNQFSATQTFNPKFIQSDFIFQKELIKILNLYGKEYLFLSDLSIINAWIIFFERYSHNSHFYITDLLPLIKNALYQNKLKEYNMYKRYFTKAQRLMLRLLRVHQYRLVYIIIRIKNRLNLSENCIERI